MEEYGEIVELLGALLNTVYGLLVHHAHGPMPDIFPVRTAERAKRFMLMSYTMSALQVGTTIFDCLVKGRYPEAAALTRSLIETSAFAEYYSLHPDKARLVAQDPESLPNRKTVFGSLKREGKWPKGGPRRAFERYNRAAHIELVESIQHWSEVGGEPQITELWIRRYNPRAFRTIARDQVIPLLGIQEHFRRTMVDESESSGSEPWRTSWEFCHDPQLIQQNFPDLKMGPKIQIPGD